MEWCVEMLLKVMKVMTITPITLPHTMNPCFAIGSVRSRLRVAA
jgi:hypothetical protein